jgi:hypothetical protein
MVSRCTATEAPNASCETPSLATTFASWDHVVPERVKTYAAP